MAAKQLVGTRLDEELVEYIDSIKKEGEDRSSCLRRLVKESFYKSDNLEKIVDLIVSKHVDKKVIIEKLNSTINNNFIELNSNLISTLKIFSDQFLKVTTSVNDLSNGMNEIIEQFKNLNKEISHINSEIMTIKKRIDNFELSE